MTPALCIWTSRLNSLAFYLSRKLSKAEVQNFKLALGSYHDVLRFDIAVDDAARVRYR